LPNKLCAELEIKGIRIYELTETSFQEEAIGRMQVSVSVCFTEHDCTCTESGEHPVKWCGSKVGDLVRADHGPTFT
jgi:hypothetical protein